MPNIKRPRANCVAYCRDADSNRRIRFARVTRVKSASLIGDLVPANSEWPVVLLLPLSASEREARTLLNRMALFLDETKPARIDGIMISADGKTVDILSKANLKIQRARAPLLRSPDQVDETVSPPLSAAVIFGRPYSRQDASTYLRGTFNGIREGNGLARGRLATPWGKVIVYRRKERGLHAVLEGPKPGEGFEQDDDDQFRGLNWNFRTRQWE